MSISTNDVEYALSQLPQKTGTPVYFEFTGLASNDSSVSRLIQNTTGSPVYITQVTFYHVDSINNFDYDMWWASNPCQHTLDICTSNVDYPASTVREFVNAKDTRELVTRYEMTYYTRNAFSYSTGFRSIWVSIRFPVPVLCEKDNFIRLFKNGDTTYFVTQRVVVTGYY